MSGYIIISNLQTKTKIEDVDIFITVDRTNPILGNPFVLKNKNDLKEREKVINQYKELISNDIVNKGEMFQELEKIANTLQSGKNVHLQCWCTPLPCHAEIIAEKIQEMIPNIVYRPKKHYLSKFG